MRQASDASVVLYKCDYKILDKNNNVKWRRLLLLLLMQVGTGRVTQSIAHKHCTSLQVEPQHAGNFTTSAVHTIASTTPQWHSNIQLLTTYLMHKSFTNERNDKKRLFVASMKHAANTTFEYYTIYYYWLNQLIVTQQQNKIAAGQSRQRDGEVGTQHSVRAVTVE